MTREFEHCQGCKNRDLDNCGACALTDLLQSRPNYAGWPLAYMENGRTVPAKWRKAFYSEFKNKDNPAYTANLRATLAKHGVRFTESEGGVTECIYALDSRVL